MNLPNFRLNSTRQPSPRPSPVGRERGGGATLPGGREAPGCLRARSWFHGRSAGRGIRLGLLAIVVLGFGLLLGGCSKPGAAAHAPPPTLYTCGMHPQIILEHPGNCPICGMKLTPIPKTGGDANVASTAIAIDPVTIQNMNLRTAEVIRGPLRRTVRTYGVVDYSEPGLADVTTKFKGWIDKLYVDATGQQVHRGEPLFEIYSPDLYSAEVEYLLALNAGSTNDPGGAALRSTAAAKLRFYDVADAQIAELERTREPRKTLAIQAPIEGFVTEKMVVAGQMVDAGMKLYRLADLGTVWVYAQVYEPDLPFIRLGQEAVVKVASLPDREFRGRVTYVYPTVDEKTRTARVRMEFHNPGYFLKPGMFATVLLTSELKPSVVRVPDSSVLRSGERTTVFVVLGGGKFEPRDVMLGLAGENDEYEVLGGLREGERVVTSGQFMLDSESQLREAIRKMTGPASSSTSSASGATPAAGRAPAEAPVADMVYVCPMPEHVSIEYLQPGRCPICGMTLVPVSAAERRLRQPAGPVLYYTCPMPEHSDVHESKPGKCPRCGMTLIPVLAPAASPAPSPAPAPVLYTCPMASHADVVTNRPGRCPKCDMELVPVSGVKHGAAAEANWQKQQSGPDR
jgi:multidrug efflux pump subunit AcrA (membrane-fusion protein)